METFIQSLPLISSILITIALLLAFYSWQEVWDRIARRYVADLTPTIQALGIDQTRLPRYLRLWGFALVAVFLFFTVVRWMPPIALAAVYFVYIAPRLWLRSRITRRRALLRDLLVGATEALANTTRAGLALAQGLDSISRETAKPLADELGQIVKDYERGMTLGAAITATKDRLQLDSFAIFAAAVLTSLERGGRITETLERISRSLQENQRLERKMESETASGKRVVVILALFPFMFLLLFLLVYPTGTLMVIDTLIGQIILLVVIVLVYISVLWSQKVLRLE